MAASNVQDQQVLAALTKLEAAGRDTKPAMQGIGRAIQSRVLLGFRASRAPSGATWAPLKSRTGKPLEDTGVMRRSINVQATAEETSVGTNARQAPVHQFGATIKAKNHPFLRFKMHGKWVMVKQVEIPARPFLPLDAAGNGLLPPAWANDATNTVLRHYAKAVGQ